MESRSDRENLITPGGGASCNRPDKRLIKQDVAASIAHAAVLNKAGLLSDSELQSLHEALTDVFRELSGGSLEPVADGVPEFIDGELIERVGKELARKLGIARSYDDRMIFDLRLYVGELCSSVIAEIEKLIETLIGVGEAHLRTIMPVTFGPGKGLPTTPAHTFAAFAEALLRDAYRFDAAKRAAEVVTLYSGLGTGVTLDVDRNIIAELMGISDLARSAADAICDNDYLPQFGSAIAILCGHLENIAATLSDWENRDEPFITSPFGKVVPKPERICSVALTRARSTAAAAGAINGFACGKIDYAEAENALRTAETGAIRCIGELRAIISRAEFYADTFNTRAMYKAAQSGFPTAYDCYEYLLDKGAEPSEAATAVNSLAAYCTKNGLRPESLPPETFNEYSELFADDIIPFLKVKNSVRRRKHPGEPSDVSVRAEIRSIRKRLAALSQ